MRIIVTESQLKRLIEKKITENIESLGDPDPSGVPEYTGDKVSADITITDTDGDVKMSKKKTLDKISNDQTPQSWYSNGRKLASRN